MPFVRDYGKEWTEKFGLSEKREYILNLKDGKRRGF